MTLSPAAEQELRDDLATTQNALADLRARLKEPEEIIRAIREGEVDALVVTDPNGEKIYTLRSVDLLFRRMVEEMREGAVALEPSGLIVYANGCFAGLMKTEREGLLGTSILSFVPEESRAFFDMREHAARQGIERQELVLRAADGQPVPVQVSMNAIELDEGAVFCLIVTDLRGERRREQLLNESRQKDEFLAMLAHELRNPIAPIRNATHVIALSEPEEPRVRWAREVIDRQAAQLSRLVDDLLDISRVTRGKIRLEMAPADLELAVARGIETAEPALESRRHRLSVTMPSERLLVLGDAARLSQVISNVLHNAAKFTPEGRNVFLTLARRDGDAVITVKDEGIGIRPELLTTIFDPFTQADATIERAQGGLGIGLALVRSLVQMHGGQVEARSEGLGRGSEFVVTIPLFTDAEEGADVPKTKPESPPEPSPRRVLVVDDNVDAAESLTILLQDLRHEALMVTTGSAVLETARAFRPDVVLLDLSLPDMSGFEVAVELRRCEELRPLHIVALTGYGQEDHRRRSREVGFDQHWVKPVDLDVLQRLLASIPPPSAANGV